MDIKEKKYKGTELFTVPNTVTTKQKWGQDFEPMDKPINRASGHN